MNFSHLANKLRSKITRFSGMLSQDFHKTARRFIQEAAYGIMASQTEDMGCIHDRVLSMAKARVKENTN